MKGKSDSFTYAFDVDLSSGRKLDPRPASPLKRGDYIEKPSTKYDNALRTSEIHKVVQDGHKARLQEPAHPLDAWDPPVKKTAKKRPTQFLNTTPDKRELSWEDKAKIKANSAYRSWDVRRGG
jgi:hypothetical protein